MPNIQGAPIQDIKTAPQSLQFWYNKVKRTLDDLLNAVFATTDVTANYTILATDHVILVNATSAAVTVTLPDASEVKEFHIKKIDSSGNAVTVARAGTDTIEGSTSVSLAAQYNSVTLYSDGSTTWYKKATT